jgi:hypothetical protein
MSDNCVRRCDNPFQRVMIHHAVVGGTQVQWALRREFVDDLPHDFQLQVGRTANPDADDWEHVGLPVRNSYYAIDPEQRVWGKTLWTHYRVQLTTPAGVYLSEPTFGMGLLNRTDWLKAKTIRRKARRYQKDAGSEGYLFKRRLYGTPCSCIDKQTQEVLIPEHAECYGTGIQGGYFAPLGCVWAIPLADDSYEHQDDETRGSINPRVQPMYLDASVPLFTDDIWVRKSDDQRFFVHPLHKNVGIRSVPILQTATMKLIPFSHIIYQLPLTIDIPEPPAPESPNYSGLTAEGYYSLTVEQYFQLTA